MEQPQQHNPFAPPAFPATMPAPARKRKVLYAVLAGVVALVVAATVMGQWRARDDGSRPAAEQMQILTGDRFTVSLPGEPDKTQEAVPGGGMSMTMYQVEHRRSAYTVGYFDMPAGMAYDVDKGIEGSVKGANGTLVSSSKGTFQGYPSADVVAAVSDRGTDGTAFTTLVVADRRVYVLSTVVPGTGRQVPDGARMVRESLRIT